MKSIAASSRAPLARAIGSGRLRTAGPRQA